MSDNLVAKGEVLLIGDTETFGANGFKKRLIVIRTNEQYPQDLQFEFVQAKAEILDNYAPGQEVSISYNLRGSEYQGKYYVSLQGWRIVKAEVAETKDPLS